MTSATILGARVDAIGRTEAISRIADLAEGTRPSLIVTIGTEMIVRARSDAAFRAAIDTAALSLCDTIGVVLAARLHGVRIEERVTGVELIEPLCAELARRGRSVYFVGAKGDTAERAAAAVKTAVPSLIVAGARDGYFPAEREDAIAAEIAASGASVAFVGLGSPRQERFITTALAAHGVPVGIGIGGSFDVLAGNVERAPEAWRKLGFEWLYRLMKEPSRFRRQMALPRFVVLALCERAGVLRRSPS